MGSPQPSYTKASDGTSIAYLVMGDGPVDLVYAFGYQSNIDGTAMSRSMPPSGSGSRSTSA